MIIPGVWFWQPLEFVLGGESPEGYLSRTRPNYEAYNFLANYSDLTPVVLSDGSDFTIYQPVALHYPLSFRLNQLFLPLSEEDPGRLAKSLNAMGITHIVTKFLTWNDRFIETYLLPEFSSNDFTVYRLIPDGYTRSLVPVIENGSFDLSDGSHPYKWGPINSPNYICDVPASYDESCFVIVDGPNYYYQDFPAKPEQIFHYTFYTRSDTADGSIRFQISWASEKGELIDTYTASTTVVGDWRRIQGYAISPPGTASAWVYIISNSDAAIQVDKCMVSYISIPEQPDLETNSFKKAELSSALWNRIFSCVNSSDRSCLDFLWKENKYGS